MFKKKIFGFVWGGVVVFIYSVYMWLVLYAWLLCVGSKDNRSHHKESYCYGEYLQERVEATRKKHFRYAYSRVGLDIKVFEKP